MSGPHGYELGSCGRKSTLQLAVPSVLAAILQLVEGPKIIWNGEEEKVTVPVGVMAAPPLEVSITVAVQVEAWFTTTELGVQLIDVEVIRRMTVMPDGVVVELPL